MPKASPMRATALPSTPSPMTPSTLPCRLKIGKSKKQNCATSAQRPALTAEWNGATERISDRISAKVCRSEEHTSELQSLMRISYAVFCLKKKTIYSTPYIKQTTPHTYSVYDTTRDKQYHLSNSNNISKN